MAQSSKQNGNTAATQSERHDHIMDTLRQRSSVPVTELAAMLKVSEVTIRKDLNILESKNMLYRAHGSAVLINPYINNRDVNEKEKLAPEEKRAIGRCAAKLVTPDDTILIASGTTMMAFAREIRDAGQLTAITSAVNVAMILAQDKDINIVQLGGMLRNSSVSAVGPYAERMLSNFSCSKLFLGVDGIDPDFGLTTTNLMEASLNNMMINSVQKVIILTDSSKFGRKGFAKICDLTAVDQIITDDKIPERICQRLIDYGIEVTIAG